MYVNELHIHQYGNGNATDVNTLVTRGFQDGIKEILPQSAREKEDTFMKEDLVVARDGEVIYGDEFESSSDGNKIFRIKIFKSPNKDGVQWLHCGMKDCSPVETQTDTLITFSISVNKTNNKVRYSLFLRAGCETETAPALCRVDELPKYFTLSSSVWSAHFTVQGIIANGRALHLFPVCRPEGQGQSKVCKSQVNWTLFNLGPQENFTRGECIFSELFGDVQEEIVMALKVYPNGSMITPAGQWPVYVNVLRLPERSRRNGLKITYKISANGDHGEETITFKEGQTLGFYFESSFYNSVELRIILEVDFRLDSD